ncbi:diguanylate cyclase [Modicisalibacter tunisiensis]|uniref:diguanylate cyclase domain-containing protein n=1 Tax=Modicisalibacter tunisiensis TaxID=390637 RepID=UPI001CCA6C36|nr:diguanylate cyclase [Modicisalibacter tunisiensis]MBZ9537683.1 diguanylate cyclase [Modicisalibacter tunisiensis]
MRGFGQRDYERLFLAVYTGGMLLIATHALWHYLMGHYDAILLPALLTLLLAGALFVRLVNPGLQRMATYAVLISGYLLTAAELAEHGTQAWFWLGVPPALTFLLLPLAPAALLNLSLTPVWLLLALPTATLWQAGLAYLALIGLLSLPARLALQRRFPRRDSEQPDAQCDALSHHALTLRLAAEVERGRALKCPLAVLVIHLPQLEMAEEQFGSHLLQALLDRACTTIRANCRQHDLLGRERVSLFWLLLPDTGEAGALIVRERLLQALNRDVFAETGTIQVRIRGEHLLPGDTLERFEQRLTAAGLKLLEPSP